MSDNKRKSRSGMSADRAHRIQKKLAERLRDIYAQARSFHLTHDDIADKVWKEVLQSEECKKAPAYVGAYLRGMWDTLRDVLYQYHIMWVLSLDGKLMTSKEVDALTEQETADMYRAYVQRCGEPSDGTFRHPPTFEEFRRNNGRQVVNGRETYVGYFIPNDYRSPWSRINVDLSRHVWKDANGKPLLDKPYDRRFKEVSP